MVDCVSSTWPVELLLALTAATARVSRAEGLRLSTATSRSANALRRLDIAIGDEEKENPLRSTPIVGIAFKRRFEKDHRRLDVVGGVGALAAR